MKTVFIVDDSDTNRMAAKTALDEIYKTYAIPSAQRMFKLLDKITPDIILLDIRMPEMDGFEALEVLKQNENSKNIPVIFLTAKNDPETEQLSHRAGASDFIIKPFFAPDLIERIEKHLTNN